MPRIDRLSLLEAEQLMARQARVGATDQDRTLHARLLAGDDPSVTSDLVSGHLESLLSWLRLWNQRVDPHVLEEIAIDVVLSVARNPRQFAPERGSLAAYLRMSARGDVRNALRSETHRRRREVSLDDVELMDPEGNSIVEPAFDPEAAALDSDSEQWVRALVGGGFDGSDREVIHLMVDGERRTSVYARALGIQGSGKEEQAREVKRVKDRLRKRLARLWRTRDDNG